MRRKERECAEPSFFNELLTSAQVMIIAFQTETFPYVIPVNFVFMDGALYVHSATEGRKLDCLHNAPDVGFSVYELLGIDREKATTLYSSLYGEGQAHLVRHDEEKQAALAALAKKYQSHCPCPIPDAMLKKTAVLKIEIHSLSGKRHLP